MVRRSKGARVRARVNHPVIDADGHWLELNPIFFEYVREVAGAAALEKVQEAFARRGSAWYDTSPGERQRRRMMRTPFWGTPTNADDRAAAMIPGLFHERLDAWGIDVAVVFPSLGLGLTRELTDPEVRVPVLRAYNTMVAEMFRPYSDRIIPVGVVGLAEPREAIATLEHAHSLGLKVLATGGTVPRPVAEDADWQSDARRRRVFVDGLGLDSPHDYDPVWAKFIELRIPVTTHSGSMGWPDRNSPSNFVANHLGHFAQSHHLFARSLFLGGVTQRFPQLNFGFLEGGVGWACNLYADLMGHWEKRNRKFMHERLKPTMVNVARIRELMERHAGDNPRFAGKLDEILTRNLEPMRAAMSLEESAARDMDSDDFSRVNASSKDDVRRLFADNFYFGCEADDPMTAIAFNDKLGLRLKPVLGSDISHFDVIDATEVLEEAFELVEHGLIGEEDFCDFTFRNAVRLFAGMNADFFKGTIVENAVSEILKSPNTAPA
jgi:predicted TIM-barrel fold metal-dependent hydrolase